MYVEFLYLLERSLDRFGTPIGVHKIEITAAPPTVDATLATNAAFIIAKSAADQLGGLQPLEVAERFVETIRSHPGPLARLFDFSIGGLGHINATLTEDGASNVLRLLTEATFSETNCFESLVEGKSLQEPSLLIPARERSWLPDAIVRAERQQDEDVAVFLKTYAGRFEHEPAARVMLYAILSDPELEAATFLDGRRGQDNVPWAIEHFLTVSAALLEGFDSSTAIEEHFSNPFRALPERESRASMHIERSFNCVAIELLALRWMMIQARRRQRPELLVGSIRKLLSGFFSLYNLPEFRRGALDRDPSRAQVLALIRGVRRGVENALFMLTS